LPGTNTLAYYKHLWITAVKSFVTLALSKSEETDLYVGLGSWLRQTVGSKLRYSISADNAIKPFSFVTDIAH